MPLRYPAAATDGLMAEPPDFAPGNLLAVSSTGDATDLGYTPDQLSASIISKAAAGLTQMGQWNAATALATTGATLGATPTTEPIGGYYETITAGTRYGQTWVVGDRLLVAQTPAGAKVWGKQQALGDIFDAASVYAASSTGVDTQSGTMLRPKKTLSGAFAVVAQPGTIDLAPGSYGTVGASLSVTKQNIFVSGKGANSSNQVTLSDNITLNAARFRLRDVNVAGTVTWSDTTGGHQLLGVGGLSNFIFFGGVTARGFAIISDCDLTSTLNSSNIFLQNLGAGTATLYLTRTSSARLSVGTGWTVIVTDCKDLMITSNAGTVIHSDDLPVIAFLDTQAALTTAINDVSSAANGLYILGFDGATGVMGNPAKGDVLYKLAQGVMGLHKKYAWAPATVFGPSGRTFYKTGGYWTQVPTGIPTTHSSVVQIDGMLTAPTKPTVRTVDNITVVEDGSGWCTCTMQLICDSMAGASPGAGVYIFRLPVSAPWFDLTQHPPVTSTSGALSTNAERGRILPGSTGVMIHGVRRALVACAYDGGRFILAVAGHIHSDQWDKVRGDYFEFTSSLSGGGSWLISFRYKRP